MNVDRTSTTGPHAARGRSSNHMEFGPIGGRGGGTATCDSCGKEFPIVGENAMVENQCIPCQVKFRITNANRAHQTGNFPVYTAWWENR